MRNKLLFLSSMLLVSPVMAEDVETLGVKISENSSESKIVSGSQYEQISYVTGYIENEELDGELEGLENFFVNGLKGYGHYFKAMCDKYDVNMDLALAISTLETGYASSNLCVYDHNYGGMMYAGQGMSFESAEVGIEKFISLIADYKAKGMDSPESMAYVYAGGSDTWADKVNNILNTIKEKREEIAQLGNIEQQMKDAYSLAETFVGQSGQCTEIAQRFIDAYFGYGNIYQAVPISAEEARPGDVIYYVNGGIGWQHYAIYLGDGLALHGNSGADPKTAMGGIAKIGQAASPWASEPMFRRIVKQ